MKFGLLFRPQDPPDAANIGQRWQEILAAGQAAEEAGWDGLFVPEHHMMPDAYLPSPWRAAGRAGGASRRASTSARPCTCCRSSTRSTSPSTRRWSTSSRAGG